MHKANYHLFNISQILVQKLSEEVKERHFLNFCDFQSSLDTLESFFFPASRADQKFRKLPY